MTQKNHTTNLTELLLQCVAQPDPMLSMLEWLCSQLMEAEVSQQLGAGKSERVDSRSGYRCGYRPRRLDTRMGTMYQCWCQRCVIGGYIPFFVTERKRIEAALIQVVQEAFVPGRIHSQEERLAQSLGIESLSRQSGSVNDKGTERTGKHFPQPLSFPKQVSHFVGGRPVRKSSYGRQNCKHGGVCGLWYR